MPYIVHELYEVTQSHLVSLQPTPQRIRPEHAQTLEKYAWQTTDDDVTVNCLSADLFLLLQSVVVRSQRSTVSVLTCSCFYSLLWYVVKGQLSQC